MSDKKYPPATYTEILIRISEGESLGSICSEPDMPSRSTVYEKVRSEGVFAKSYSEAIKARAQSRVDEMMRILAKLEQGLIDPQSARVTLDTLRWLSSREDPTRFGDKLLQELTGKDGKDLIPERKMDDLEMARWIAHLLRQGELQAGKLIAIEDKTDGE